MVHTTNLDSSALDSAVDKCTEALRRCPAWGVHRRQRLEALAEVLHQRFQLSGRIQDIDLAVTHQKRALETCQPWNPGYIVTASNLAVMILRRFEQFGNMADLDEAIQRQRTAVDLLQRTQRHRDGAISNLGVFLLQRFEQCGDTADLTAALQLHRDALALRPTHPCRSHSLDNLGSCLGHRFEQKGDIADLDEAVELLRNAVAAPNPDRANSLNNLGECLHIRFEQKGDIADLDEAVQLHRDALALCPALNPDRANSLNNLGSCLHSRFNQKGDVADLDEAVQLHRDALALCPAPNQDRALSFNNLGVALASYAGTLLVDSLPNALMAFQEASADSSASLLSRFRAAKAWALVAHGNAHASALEAFRIAIGMLPQLAALSLDIRSRQAILVVAKSHDLGSDAAVCAIGLGQYDVATELLEAGRSVFWSQSLHLRTPLDNLRVSYPSLASQLTELSRKLEQRSFRDTTRNFQIDSHARVMWVEKEEVNCRHLNEEWLKLVEHVRMSVPGFEEYIQAKHFPELRLAASQGPVVVLIAGKIACHALIVEVSNIRCVSVPGLTRHFVDWLAQLLRAILGHTSLSAFLAKLPSRGHDFKSTLRLLGGRDGEKDHDPQLWFQAVLAKLWESIVSPVLTVLGIKKSENPTRLWWCPTGPFTFLPLHAAGIYHEESGNESVDDYVISSYTPTLAALLCPPFPNYTASDPLRTTVVIQPQTPGHSSLPNTEEELRKIKERVPKEWLASFGSSRGLPASLEAVLQHLPTSSIMHFACHGVQDIDKPLNSALMIGSDRLTVAEIMKQSGVSQDAGNNAQRHMGLAFLSACQTAMGDRNVPDEAIHLAGTLLFAGFRSVVATMWTMQDLDGPEVAEAFYGHLFRDADPTANPPVFADLSESAEALHLAVKKLRTHVPFERWVPFVHYGL